MPKLISLIKRQGHLTHEEFRDYYENVHVPLALKHHGKFMADYRRNYVRREFGYYSADRHEGGKGNPVGGPWLDYDAVLETSLRDEKALNEILQEVKARSADPQLIQSRARFIDLKYMRTLIVDEEISNLSALI